MTPSFFAAMPGFTDFSEACNTEHYHPAPENWFIIHADIEESTAAIQAGRYKDVNMVGAACITAVVNSCKGVEIPFVFGGDGATLLVPPDCVDDARKALRAVRKTAKACHGLSLRIGVIPVKEISRRGRRFEVAKYCMPTGYCMAMFHGGGAALADELLKQGFYRIDGGDDAAVPDLNGLSCRWNPIPSRHGTIMTLLILSRDPASGDAVYREINRFISGTFDRESPQGANPVHEESMTYKWPTLETLRQCRMVWGQKNIAKNLLGHIFDILLFRTLNRFEWVLNGFDVTDYRRDVIVNSDYRKFDDMLRMVVDCSEDQAKAVERYLEKLHREGRIVYGLHYSKTALMTCFVQSLESSGHVHFIDGDNGGYAMAAQQLKQQLGRVRIGV